MAYVGRFGANFPNDYYKPEIWSALTLERWYADCIIPKIANTDYEGEIKKCGQLVHIRRDPDAVVQPYIMDTPIQWQNVVDEKTTLTIDYAYSAAHKVDTLDLAQMDIDVIGKIAKAINKQMAMKEMEVLFNALPLIACNPSNIVDGSGNARTTAVADTYYILKDLAALRTAFNRRRVPKEGRYIIVSPEVEEILLRSDNFRYDVVGRENTAVSEGKFGIQIMGFDIIPNEYVPLTAANVYTCIAGIRGAFTFARQLTEVTVGMDLQDYFGKGIKALNVFGFGMTQPNGMGLWKCKVA